MDRLSNQNMHFFAKSLRIVYRNFLSFSRNSTEQSSYQHHSINLFAIFQETT